MVWENGSVALTAHEEPDKVECISSGGCGQIHIKTDIEGKVREVAFGMRSYWLFFPSLWFSYLCIYNCPYFVCDTGRLTQALAHSEPVLYDWATFLSSPWVLFVWLLVLKQGSRCGSNWPCSQCVTQDGVESISCRLTLPALGLQTCHHTLLPLSFCDHSVKQVISVLRERFGNLCMCMYKWNVNQGLLSEIFLTARLLASLQSWRNTYFS